MTEREKLNQYVRWNQLTRHQIITAHLTLIEGADHSRHRLAKAFGIESYLTTDDVVDQVISKWRSGLDALGSRSRGRLPDSESDS